MRLSSLLYIILLIKLVRSEQKITFHLLEPDIFQVTLDVREDSGLEIKKYIPRDGFRINKVKYGDKELWKSRWIHKDGCKSIQFHSKGETRLVALWIVNNNDTLDIKRFNKVGDNWEKIELEGFNQKIREAKGREAGSHEGTEDISPGSQLPASTVQQDNKRPIIAPAVQSTPVPDFKSKVDSTLFDVRESTIDGPFYLTCTPKSDTKVKKLKYNGKQIWSGSKIIGNSSNLVEALIYFDGYKPRLVTLQSKKSGKNKTIFLYEDTGKWKENKDEHTKRLKILKETCEKNRPKKQPQVKPVDKPVESPVPEQSPKPTEPKEEVPKAPTPPKPTTPVTLDITNPDKFKVYADDQYTDGVRTKKYSPRNDHYISSVMEGTVEVWKAKEDNEKCKVVRGYAKDGIEILYLHIDCNGSPSSRHFEKKSGAWHEIDVNTFDKKAKEIRGEPENPFLDKVDTSIFDLRELNGDNVKTLKLTAKEGVAVNTLGFDGELVWEDSQTPCLSAVLYLDGDKPTLAVLETKDKDNATKVYRYHDGNQWKNGNEDDHNSKLEALKKNCKNADLNKRIPAKQPRNQDRASVKQESTETPPSVKREGATGVRQNTPNPTPSPANTAKQVTSQASTPRPTTPFKLDITNPDKTKITIKDVNGNGLSYREYVAKGGYHISSVLDGKVDLWIAPQGQQCIAVKSFIQEADTIIAVFIKEGETTRRKCIEKVDGSWRDIEGKTFEEKLQAIRGEESVRSVGNEGTGNDGSPFNIVSPDNEEVVTPKPNAAKKSEHVVNVHASEIYTPPAKKQEVVPKPEAVKEDTEPQVQSKSTNCSLDLANIDEDEIAVKVSDYGGGVKQKDFSPKEGFKIDYILNNGTPVIKLSEGEEFRSIRLYSKRSSHLLMVTIKKPEGIEHKYYEKIAGDWYKLKNQTEFNRKLNEMKSSR